MTEKAKTGLKAFIAVCLAAIFVLSACVGNEKENEPDKNEPLSLTDVHYGAEAGAVEKRESADTYPACYTQQLFSDKTVQTYGRVNSFFISPCRNTLPCDNTQDMFVQR